jgi:hypothetical protein
MEDKLKPIKILLDNLKAQEREIENRKLELEGQEKAISNTRYYLEKAIAETEKNLNS